MTSPEAYAPAGRPARGTEIRISPAVPGATESVAALHALTFGDRFMGFMGLLYLRRFYDFLVRDSEAVVQVAYAGGQMVGFVAGMTCRRGLYRRFVRQCLAGVMMDVLRTVIRRPAQVSRVVRLFRRSRGRTSYAEEAFLLALAVHPDWRRLGVAVGLLAAFDGGMRVKGVAAYALTTEAQGNDGTNRFYQRQGLVLVRSFVPPGREGFLNEYRRVL